jgi:hypothetical protein
MDRTEELLELERAGWGALSTPGDALPFYEQVLAAEVLMLLPGGLVIDDRDAALEAMSGAAWDSFDLGDERVVNLAPNCAVVAYHATARRGDTDYEALITSTYTRAANGWKLALHQQTPV